MELDPAEPIPASRSVVESLYAQHGDELRRFLWGILRDNEVVQDVLQSSLVIALEAGSTARQETLKGWLFRVAYHEALQHRRRLGTTRKVLSQAVWINEASIAGPDDLVQQKETQEAIRKALDRLPKTEQEVVRLRIHAGLTFAEVARELEIPLGTVLTRMRSALEKLRQKLHGKYGTRD
jgi:RNA polymerase sigma-70 factor (ECF subfamily)